MAAQKKWYKGWRMKVGSVLLGAGGFFASLPAISIATINGEPVSLTSVLLGVGATLMGYGAAGKMEDLKPKE